MMTHGEAPKAFPAPPRPRLIASRPDPVGSVVEVMAEIMEPGMGKVEIADVFAAYADECAAQGKRPIPASEFPGAMAELCKRIGIQIEDSESGTTAGVSVSGIWGAAGGLCPEDGVFLGRKVCGISPWRLLRRRKGCVSGGGEFFLVRLGFGRLPGSLFAGSFFWVLVSGGLP